MSGIQGCRLGKEVWGRTQHRQRQRGLGSAETVQGAPTCVTQAHSPIPTAGAPNIAHFTDPLVEATIMVYSTITSQLLPTPAKSHYTFNLRDLSKVFQGMLMANPAKIEVRTWQTTSPVSMEECPSCPHCPPQPPISGVPAQTLPSLDPSRPRVELGIWRARPPRALPSCS